MTDRHAGRLNRRAPRGRDGRSASEPRQTRRAGYAVHALAVWAEWTAQRHETGWPRESCEVRAFEASQRATVTDGIARYRGTVEWLDDAGNRHRARREPPAAPKETRPSAGPRVPLVDRSRLGPRVSRLLLDLDGEGESGFRVASVLRAGALYPRSAGRVLAAGLGISERTYWRLRRRGLAWLEFYLTMDSGPHLARATTNDP